MNIEEYAAKPLLADALIPLPLGRVTRTPGDVCAIAAEIGAVLANS